MIACWGPVGRVRGARSIQSDAMRVFRLPLPPSVNDYWRIHKGRILLSSAGRNYRQTVLGELFPQKAMTGRLALEVLVCAPDLRRRDLDNLMKGLQDALAHAGVYENDCQIDALRVDRGPTVRPGMVVVCVEPNVARTSRLEEWIAGATLSGAN